MKNIHEELKKIEVELSGHYSDLYCPVNDITREIINRYEYKESVTTFISQIDGKLWYDIPFANVDYKKFQK